MVQDPAPPSIAATVVELMGTLRGRWTPFPMDNYDHSLQTATRAMRAGADTDLVVAALLHDVGKSIAAVHHGNVAASMLNGLVRPEVVWVVRVHQAFTAREFRSDWHRYSRYRYRASKWFALAEVFVDEWDLPSFDPDYPTLTLDDFVPLVDTVFSRRPALVGVDKWRQSTEQWIDHLPAPTPAIARRVKRAVSR